MPQEMQLKQKEKAIKQAAKLLISYGLIKTIFGGHQRGHRLMYPF